MLRSSGIVSHETIIAVLDAYTPPSAENGSIVVDALQLIKVLYTSWRGLTVQ